MTRTVDAELGAAGVFGAEHRRLLGYLQRARGDGPAPETSALRERYTDDVRATAVGTWRLRMVNEHRSSGVFAGLHGAMMECGSAFAVQTTVLRMALDEVHHAELCGRVVTAFGGAPRAEAEAVPASVPRHTGVSPLESAMRNALFVGCLAETVAVALVSHERSLATEPLVRWTLDQILGDEVSHARFGWTFVRDALPGLGVEAVVRTNAYLRVAFGYLEAAEHTFLPVADDPSAELAAQREALGLCRGQDARDLFADTVRTVIVPQLGELGLDAASAWSGRRRMAA